MKIEIKLKKHVIPLLMLIILLGIYSLFISPKLAIGIPLHSGATSQYIADGGSLKIATDSDLSSTLNIGDTLEIKGSQFLVTQNANIRGKLIIGGSSSSSSSAYELDVQSGDMKVTSLSEGNVCTGGNSELILCDNCPDVNNSDQTDTDNDGFGDVCDNCPDVNNSDQTDTDNDGFGDVCDNCQYTQNSDQANSDGDIFGDVCDNCPDLSNSNQVDENNNGFGDVCEDTIIAPPNIPNPFPEASIYYCHLGGQGGYWMHYPGSTCDNPNSPPEFLYGNKHFCSTIVLTTASHECMPVDNPSYSEIPYDYNCIPYSDNYWECTDGL